MTNQNQYKGCQWQPFLFQTINKKPYVSMAIFPLSPYLCASCLKSKTLPEVAPKVSPCGERLKGITKQAF